MIVGLIGRAGSGKTTAAKVITGELNFEKHAFADPLKKMLINAGMCTYDECYVEKTEQSRWLMQKVGTEIFRNQVDDNWWILQAKGMVSEALTRIPNVVLDDVRFPNEADAIKDMGGILIKIEREGHLQDKTDHTHASETQIDKIEYDHIITAKSGDVDGLISSVRELMKTLI